MQSKEFKVTHSSNFTKVNESSDSMNVILKNAQLEIENTLEKVDEGEWQQVPVKSPTL